jgi:hypothetical protein
MTTLPSLARSSALVAVTLLAFQSTSRDASGAGRDEKEVCVAASDQAQTLRDENKFRRAREALLTCARDACPGIVRKDCEKWLAELDASYPSVAIGARDARGHDVLGVRVLLDGAVLTERLDGKPMPIEPGEHFLRYESAGTVPFQERVVIRVGEKNRALTVQLQPAAASAASESTPAAAHTDSAQAAASSDASASPATPSGAPGEKTRSPALALVFGGIGVAALGSFAYFGVTGKADINELRSSCAPHCEQSQVDDAKRKLLIADISLGVGIVGLAAATWVFLAQSASPSPAASALDVRALPGGGMASLRGSF